MDIHRIAYLLLVRKNGILHVLQNGFFVLTTSGTICPLVSCVPCFFRVLSVRVHEVLDTSVPGLDVRTHSLVDVVSSLLGSIQLPTPLHPSLSRFPSRSRPSVCSTWTWFIFLAHSAAHPPACTWWISALLFFLAKRCGNAGMVLPTTWSLW